jgi:hypothetical protein
LEEPAASIVVSLSLRIEGTGPQCREDTCRYPSSLLVSMALLENECLRSVFSEDNDYKTDEL